MADRTTHHPEADIESFRDILDMLAKSAPAAPPIDWVRYRGDLRAKLAARREPRKPLTWWRPVPLAASVAFAGVLLLLAVTDLHQLTPGDPPTVEETILAERLDIVRHQALLEKLDLFEDLEVIRNLGPLAAQQEG